MLSVRSKLSLSAPAAALRGASAAAAAASAHAHTLAASASLAHPQPLPHTYAVKGSRFLTTLSSSSLSSSSSPFTQLTRALALPSRPLPLLHPQQHGRRFATQSSAGDGTEKSKGGETTSTSTSSTTSSGSPSVSGGKTSRAAVNEILQRAKEAAAARAKAAHAQSNAQRSKKKRNLASNNGNGHTNGAVEESEGSRSTDKPSDPRKLIVSWSFPPHYDPRFEPPPINSFKTNPEFDFTLYDSNMVGSERGYDGLKLKLTPPALALWHQRFLHWTSPRLKRNEKIVQQREEYLSKGWPIRSKVSEEEFQAFVKTSEFHSWLSTASSSQPDLPYNPALEPTHMFPLDRSADDPDKYHPSFEPLVPELWDEYNITARDSEEYRQWFESWLKSKPHVAKQREVYQRLLAKYAAPVWRRRMQAETDRIIANEQARHQLYLQWKAESDRANRRRAIYPEEEVQQRLEKLKKMKKILGPAESPTVDDMNLYEDDDYRAWKIERLTEKNRQRDEIDEAIAECEQELETLRKMSKEERESLRRYREKHPVVDRLWENAALTPDEIEALNETNDPLALPPRHDVKAEAALKNAESTPLSEAVSAAWARVHRAIAKASLTGRLEARRRVKEALSNGSIQPTEEDRRLALEEDRRDREELIRVAQDIHESIRHHRTLEMHDDIEAYQEQLMDDMEKNPPPDPEGYAEEEEPGATIDEETVTEEAPLVVIRSRDRARQNRLASRIERDTRHTLQHDPALAVGFPKWFQPYMDFVEAADKYTLAEEAMIQLDKEMDSLGKKSDMTDHQRKIFIRSLLDCMREHGFEDPEDVEEEVIVQLISAAKQQAPEADPNDPNADPQDKRSDLVLTTYGERQSLLRLHRWFERQEKYAPVNHPVISDPIFPEEELNLHTLQEYADDDVKKQLLTNLEKRVGKAPINGDVEARNFDKADKKSKDDMKSDKRDVDEDAEDDEDEDFAPPSKDARKLTPEEEETAEEIQETLMNDLFEEMIYRPQQELKRAIDESNESNLRRAWKKARWEWIRMSPEQRQEAADAFVQEHHPNASGEEATKLSSTYVADREMSWHDFLQRFELAAFQVEHDLPLLLPTLLEQAKLPPNDHAVLSRRMWAILPRVKQGIEARTRMVTYRREAEALEPELIAESSAQAPLAQLTARARLVEQKADVPRRRRLLAALTPAQLDERKHHDAEVEAWMQLTPSEQDRLASDYAAEVMSREAERYQELEQQYAIGHEAKRQLDAYEERRMERDQARSALNESREKAFKDKIDDLAFEAAGVDRKKFDSEDEFVVPMPSEKVIDVEAEGNEQQDADAAAKANNDPIQQEEALDKDEAADFNADEVAQLRSRASLVDMPRPPAPTPEQLDARRKELMEEYKAKRAADYLHPLHRGKLELSASSTTAPSDITILHQLLSDTRTLAEHGIGQKLLYLRERLQSITDLNLSRLIPEAARQDTEDDVTYDWQKLQERDPKEIDAQLGQQEAAELVFNEKVEEAQYMHLYNRLALGDKDAEKELDDHEKMDQLQSLLGQDFEADVYQSLSPKQKELALRSIDELDDDEDLPPEPQPIHTLAMQLDLSVIPIGNIRIDELPPKHHAFIATEGMAAYIRLVHEHFLTRQLLHNSQMMDQQFAKTVVQLVKEGRLSAETMDKRIHDSSHPIHRQIRHVLGMLDEVEDRQKMINECFEQTLYPELDRHYQLTPEQAMEELKNGIIFESTAHGETLQANQMTVADVAWRNAVEAEIAIDEMSRADPRTLDISDAKKMEMEEAELMGQASRMDYLEPWIADQTLPNPQVQSAQIVETEAGHRAYLIEDESQLYQPHRTDFSMPFPLRPAGSLSGPHVLHHFEIRRRSDDDILNDVENIKLKLGQLSKEEYAKPRGRMKKILDEMRRVAMRRLEPSREEVKQLAATIQKETGRTEEKPGEDKDVHLAEVDESAERSTFSAPPSLPASVPAEDTASLSTFTSADLRALKMETEAIVPVATNEPIEAEQHIEVDVGEWEVDEDTMYEIIMRNVDEYEMIGFDRHGRQLSNKQIDLTPPHLMSKALARIGYLKNPYHNPKLWATRTMTDAAEGVYNRSQLIETYREFLAPSAALNRYKIRARFWNPNEADYLLENDEEEDGELMEEDMDDYDDEVLKEYLDIQAEEEKLGIHEIANADELALWKKYTTEEGIIEWIASGGVARYAAAYQSKKSSSGLKTMTPEQLEGQLSDLPAASLEFSSIEDYDEHILTTVTDRLIRQTEDLVLLHWHPETYVNLFRQDGSGNLTDEGRESIKKKLSEITDSRQRRKFLRTIKQWKTLVQSQMMNMHTGLQVEGWTDEPMSEDEKAGKRPVVQGKDMLSAPVGHRPLTAEEQEMREAGLWVDERDVIAEHERAREAEETRRRMEAERGEEGEEEEEGQTEQLVEESEDAGEASEGADEGAMFSSELDEDLKEGKEADDEVEQELKSRLMSPQLASFMEADAKTEGDDQIDALLNTPDAELRKKMQEGGEKGMGMTVATQTDEKALTPAKADNAAEVSAAQELDAALRQQEDEEDSDVDFDDEEEIDLGEQDEETRDEEEGGESDKKADDGEDVEAGARERRKAAQSGGTKGEPDSVHPLLEQWARPSTLRHTKELPHMDPDRYNEVQALLYLKHKCYKLLSHHFPSGGITLKLNSPQIFYPDRKFRSHYTSLDESLRMSVNRSISNFQLFQVVFLMRKYRNASIMAEHVAKEVGAARNHTQLIKGLENMVKWMEVIPGLDTGIRIKISGRINGAQIASHYVISSGAIPLQTIHSNIDYAFSHAHNRMGVFGVKVWLFQRKLDRKELLHRNINGKKAKRPKPTVV